MKRHRTGIAAGIGIVLSLLGTLSAAALAAPATASLSAATAATAADGTGVVAALDRAAHPLHTVEPGGDTGDLRALDRMIGAARVVGLGEATHSSHDFFALKDRVFRHLVEEKGVRTFALEGSWSTGLRLDDYVLHGTGDPGRIMSDEFQSEYLWWNNAEYLRLVGWMRAYNVRHPGDPVRFMGDDFAWTGPELYDDVTRYVARAHPELTSRLDALYLGLRPTVKVETYMVGYYDQPLAERREKAGRTAEALELLRGQPPGADRAAHDRAVQYAAVIDQTARWYAYDFADPEQNAASLLWRDRTMAENVLWWREHTGTKVLLSAHDAHVGYESFDPATYPRMQGAFLRDRLGAGYVSVGVTFDRGSFNALDADQNLRKWTLGPAGPGTAEAVLDQVRYRDYVVDLRSVSAPAREWLDVVRPVRFIGTDHPGPEFRIALGRSHDVLIHLHRVEAALLRDR
ncbi:erythromycin esterase family protein [Streptomyces sp. NPDC050263]|uniref:erythromycin esterase family protein n=1 Tax=Streptomyces sp. NPDC050263 TaxID=3155037 RepID=UPI0034315253